MPAAKNKSAKKAHPAAEKNKSLESWIWDAACSIRGAKDAPNGAERHRLPAKAARRGRAAARSKYKDFILSRISPSRYIHTSDAETYRPIAEIVDELDVIEAEAKETDKALHKILKQLGV